jgi:hypothetical protein
MAIDSGNYFSEQEELGFAVYICSKSKTLYCWISMNNKRRLFKEIAYNYLEITERLFTFSWIKFDNFDQVLNNFYASYFGCFLIPRKQLK